MPREPLCSTARLAGSGAVMQRSRAKVLLLPLSKGEMQLWEYISASLGLCHAYGRKLLTAFDFYGSMQPWTANRAYLNY